MRVQYMQVLRPGAHQEERGAGKERQGLLQLILGLQEQGEGEAAPLQSLLSPGPASSCSSQGSASMPAPALCLPGESADDQQQAQESLSALMQALMPEPQSTKPATTLAA